MATPAPVLDPDQLARIVKEEATKAADVHLNLWLKRTAAPVLLALSALGYFGYHDITNLQKLLDETTKKVNDREAKIETAQKKAEDYLAVITKTADEMLHASKENLGQLSTAKQMVDSGKDYLTNAQETARNIRGVEYRALHEAVEDQRTTTQHALELSERAILIAKTVDQAKEAVGQINAANRKTIANQLLTSRRRPSNLPVFLTNLTINTSGQCCEPAPTAQASDAPGQRPILEAHLGPGRSSIRPRQ